MNNVEWTPEWLTETIKLLRTHGSDTQFIEVKKTTEATPEAWTQPLVASPIVPRAESLSVDSMRIMTLHL